MGVASASSGHGAVVVSPLGSYVLLCLFLGLMVIGRHGGGIGSWILVSAVLFAVLPLVVVWLVLYVIFTLAGGTAAPPSSPQSPYGTKYD